MDRAAKAAILAETAFLVTLTLADIGAGYHLYETISEIVHHDTAWLARLSFAIHMVSLAALSVCVRGASAWALRLAAAGMLLVTLFDTDAGVASNPAGTIHLLGAAMAFGGVAIAGLVERRRIPLGWLVAASTLLVVAASQLGGVPLGVTERFQAYLNGAWIVLLARASDFSSTSQSPAT